jgi:hypothetical protein
MAVALCKVGEDYDVEVDYMYLEQAVNEKRKDIICGKCHLM